MKSLTFTELQEYCESVPWWLDPLARELIFCTRENPLPHRYWWTGKYWVCPRGHTGLIPDVILRWQLAEAVRSWDHARLILERLKKEQRLLQGESREVDRPRLRKSQPLKQGTLFP